MIPSESKGIISPLIVRQRITEPISTDITRKIDAIIRVNAVVNFTIPIKKRRATLYKDYIPARFGTRSASVLQVHTQEGDLNRYHISGGISGFMGRLNLQGPIQKNKASFYTSFRASTFPGALLSILSDRDLGS